MKLNKKFYVYAVILTASLALLGSQALVSRPTRRAPLDESAQKSDPAAEQVQAGAADAQPAAPAGVADPRVDRMESSLSSLQALLPADRGAELDAIGRGWAVGADAVSVSPSSFPSPASGLVPGAGSSTSAVRSLSEHAPERWPVGEFSSASLGEALSVWLTKNPLTATAVGSVRSVAAFGGELFSAGDELPQGLGSIVRIEARSVVISTRGVERRVALSPLVARPRDPANVNQAPTSSQQVQAIPPPKSATTAGPDPKQAAPTPPSPTSATDKSTPVQASGNEHANHTS